MRDSPAVQVMNGTVPRACAVVLHLTAEYASSRISDTGFKYYYMLLGKTAIFACVFS